MPPAFTDQLGRTITVPLKPRRIVSLVPSQTELLFELGLDQKIIGRTKFCIHPRSKVVSVPVVGGTKNFRFEVIQSLNPDLLVGNKEENYEEGIRRLSQSYPVWMSDIKDLEGALSMIRSLGIITDSVARAGDLTSKIEQKYRKMPDFQNRSVLYMIWRAPWMVAGGGTFIDHMLHLLNLRNLGHGLKGRYPEISTSTIRRLNPDLIFLSSEPYPFGQGHVREIEQVTSTTKTFLVKGDIFSWYGSRLVKGPAYFWRLFDDVKQSANLH